MFKIPKNGNAEDPQGFGWKIGGFSNTAIPWEFVRGTGGFQCPNAQNAAILWFLGIWEVE